MSAQATIQTGCEPEQCSRKKLESLDVAGGGQERGIYAASTWITLRCAITGGRTTIEAGSSPRSFRVAASSYCIVPAEPQLFDSLAGWNGPLAREGSLQARPFCWWDDPLWDEIFALRRPGGRLPPGTARLAVPPMPDKSTRRISFSVQSNNFTHDERLCD